MHLMALTVIGAGTVAPEVAHNLTLVLEGVSNWLQHSGAEWQPSFRHESNLVIV